ncbi:molybdate ABC transporter substrate-binding protein [Marinifilum sp.]|uniref:molybdate ABC transporter substrate-binding protein n=1 Tax=Marinifilum sp. TaxID=2033137 RepID=UPI003BA84E12
MNKTILLSLFALLLFSCSIKQKKENHITLFVASSLTNIGYEIANGFKLKTGVRVKLNIASSGILARQIENGAYFDYYISANQEWVQYIDSLGLLKKSSIEPLASNKMVAIVPKTDARIIPDEVFIKEFPNLFKGRLSLGDPIHVPAGKYARQVINFYAWTNEVSTRLLPAKNVRDALLMVEMGEAEMGIVYKTDALKSEKVNVIYEFPNRTCQSIVYVGASTKEKSKSLESFISYLQSDEVMKIWKTNGFNLD